MLALIAFIIVAIVIAVAVVGKDRVCAKVPIPFYCPKPAAAATTEGIARRRFVPQFISSPLIGMSSAEGIVSNAAFADSANAVATPMPKASCCSEGLSMKRLTNKITKMGRSEGMTDEVVGLENSGLSEEFTGLWIGKNQNGSNDAMLRSIMYGK